MIKVNINVPQVELENYQLKKTVAQQHESLSKQTLALDQQTKLIADQGALISQQSATIESQGKILTDLKTELANKGIIAVKPEEPIAK